ncbi:hypothetical protein BWD42_16715 [Sphingobacterium sp. CZ-UAM]|uniref:gluconate 2-dehydrogenase subunit 3 family protein n=1 Tax=unclassified Sphingobacterium TaxID=2609468 RepID=UPI000984F80C|nr:gluconate 2-dehydrogenase subunit 3 family protein [Sphingobacterium sp. CZ-UAM]OOG17104.1 hypothetical protein BWD42_16715 [Sphingobacterium sp. CZ-UAM]
MERRTLLKMIALLTGGAVIGGNALLTSCNSSKTSDQKNPLAFDPEQVAFLDEVAETILPTTQKSPGAKAAKVGALMTVIVNDCYESMDQQTFLEGINKLDEACNKMHQQGFMKASPEQRLELLTAISKEAKDFIAKKGESHYFTMFYQLTLLGYFSSQIGYTKARRYNVAPGWYSGDVPYKKGDKSWA